MTVRTSVRRTALCCALSVAALLCLGGTASAQVSLTTAVDLALKNSPRIKSANADIARAQAIQAQARDVFIPSLSAGAALGQAYGYSPYPPTLFQLNSSSLIYSSSQFSYIHSANAGIEAAQRSLEDTREVVAEDAALTFVSLDHDQQRDEILAQELAYSDKLVSIVEERLAAGTDSKVDLTDAKLSAANLRLARLKAADDTAYDREHLARLIGVPPSGLRVEGGFPTTPLPADRTDPYANSSIASAFANARAKQLQAEGDNKFLYRPQISFIGEYQRYATFTNAFASIEKEYNDQLGANNEVIGVQISIPLFDRLRRSKGIEATGNANKALHDAEFEQTQVLDTESRLGHSIEIAKAQSEVAGLEQERAQEQLEILQLQLQSPGSTPVPMTPKDEQNARISERQKYLAVVDAAFNLHQAQVSLLRQQGKLQIWLLHGGVAPAQPATQSAHHSIFHPFGP